MAVAASIEPGDASQKAPGALRTIKEVADGIGVPQHVLRFWETRFSQIRPVKRAGGRRYYRPDDVDLIKGIQRLLHGQGYTIRGAQRVLREKGIRFVQSVGRGEAEIAAPPAQEAEGQGAEGHDEAADDRIGAEGLTAEARGLLEAALSDLHACRARLESLRVPPESADDP